MLHTKFITVCSIAFIANSFFDCLLFLDRCFFPLFYRHGLSVEAACTSVSKDLLDVFNFALVWGRSTKFNPQRVGLSHVLMDEDVFQVVPKTLVQQKQSKDYRQKVRTL